MSEIQKHIESCRSEDPLAQTMEACGNENDLQAALQPLLAETMQGYVPVATTAPTSPIAELPGVLISIIRRVATKPLTMFGERPAKQSLLGTLLDTWNAIRQRLSGNPSAGIPDRRAEMTSHSLPTALALLNDRKIGEPNAIDGISLAQQLTSDAAAALTEIKDTNHGWTMKRAIPSYFSGLKKITLGCKRWEESADRLNPMISGLTSLEEVELEDLEYIPDDAIGSRTTCSLLSGLTACHTVWADKLKRARIVYPTGGGQAVMFWNMPALKKVYMRGLDYFDVYRTDGFNVYLANQNSIEELYLGPMNDYTANKVNLGNQTKLLKIDFPNGLNNSMNLGTWSPTLDSSNLQQFLSNFRDYIALRLTDNGSGKTLTLSQAVRNAIHAAESTYGIENIIITQKGWTISPAPN